jgi:hypothetical protein
MKGSSESIVDFFEIILIFLNLNSGANGKSRMLKIENIVV